VDYTAIQWLVCWPLMGGYIWYSEEGSGRAVAAPSLLAVPNVTAHPSVYQLHIIPCGTIITSKALSGPYNYNTMKFACTCVDLCSKRRAIQGFSSTTVLFSCEDHFNRCIFGGLSRIRKSVVKTVFVWWGLRIYFDQEVLTV